VLAAVLHTRAEVTRRNAGPDGLGLEAAEEHEAPATPATAHVEYSSDIVEVTEEYLYRPFRRPFALLVRSAQRLQAGRLDAYLAYMLIALIAVLALVTGLR
jgi:hydrogenase-4 component B